MWLIGPCIVTNGMRANLVTSFCTETLQYEVDIDEDTGDLSGRDNVSLNCDKVVLSHALGFIAFWGAPIVILSSSLGYSTYTACASLSHDRNLLKVYPLNQRVGKSNLSLRKGAQKDQNC